MHIVAPIEPFAVQKEGRQRRVMASDSLERSEQIVHLTRLCMLRDLQRRTRNSFRELGEIVAFAYLSLLSLFLDVTNSVSKAFQGYIAQRMLLFSSMDTRNILYSKGSVSSKHDDEAENVFFFFFNFNDNKTHYICIK